MLNLILQLANIVGHGVHSQRVESAVEHVCLYAYFVERFTEGTNGVVRVLASEEVHLFEGSTVGFHTVENTHVDDSWCYAFQLVFAWLKLT